MQNKNKKDDFFEQMQSFEMDKLTRFNIKFIIIMGVSITPVIILIIMFFTNANTINAVTLGIFIAFIFLCVLLGLFHLIYTVLQNSIEFMSGKLSSGIINLIISIIFAFVVIFILNKVIPEKIQSLLPTIIAAVITLFTAILALMGVHYSMMKKQEERMYKNRLIFIKDEVMSETEEYVLRLDLDCKALDICIKNISDNFGFLCSIYRVCGCDIYAIEEQLPYCPIAPKKSYVLKNIGIKTGDDQLILIYKDNEDKYYYIHLRIISSHNFEIIKIDLCNMDFIRERLKITKRMEEKLFTKKKKTINDISENDIEESVAINKENTKPIYTKCINGYELITDETGKYLTDEILLDKLKKERLIISRANRIKASYIVFTNQQLVAMATYKPIDYKSFISIYGLGEGKYNLYGERFIDIIANHING